MMNLNNLRHFKQPGNIILFIQVFFFLLALRILLKTMKLQRLLKLLETQRKMAADMDKIELIARFSNFVLNKIFRSSNPCMLRSLLLFRYLNMMGMNMKIAFGVKPEGGKLKGHAWLIYKANPFLESEDPTREYEVVYVHPDYRPGA